jgi:hypothetical protein
LIHLTTQCSTRDVSTHRRTSLGLALGVAALLAVVLLSAVPAVLAVPAPPTAPTPAATPTIFNPPCAPIITGVCVSVLNPTEPDIVPTGSSYTSSVEPNSTTSLPLYVKSEFPLNQTAGASARSGPDAPIILNVTGSLWDGTPYYSLDDGSVYHSATAQWWDGPEKTTNTTYPWWYLVNISAIGANGHPDFFPGMSISWSIEITFNVSGNFEHEGSPQSIPAGPLFHYSYSGAWPESPYAGAVNHDGAAAYDQDLTTTLIPSEPNWNDSVTATINITPADVVQQTLIGQAYLDLTEYSANDTALLSHTFVDANVNGPGTGFNRLTFVIPATYAQQANATVRYTIHASDAAGDWIDSGARSYVVGGNGTFAVGQFGDDLELVSSPSVSSPTAPIAPDTPVLLSLRSANQHTAIASATVFYSVDLPVLHETVAFSAGFTRINSTSFVGEIPALPIGSGVNFTVEAWDFASLGEISSSYNYSVEALSAALPSLAENASFFYIAVHNGGTNTWVSGATVTIAGPGSYFRTSSHTFAGLTYPNASGGPYAPIAVPADQSYLVTVTGVPSPLSVEIAAAHTMGAHRVIIAGGNYSVYQEGNLIVFWLNSTSATPTNAVPDATPIFVGSVVGLIAAAAIVVPVYGWWAQIQKRREEETKRVTL